jgi:hypothetical protein
MQKFELLIPMNVRRIRVSLSQLALILLLCLFIPTAFGQDNEAIPVNAWRTHVPFGRSQSLVQIGDNFFLGAQPGVWSFNKRNGEIQSFTKAEGLNGVSVSALGYSSETNTLVIAYTDGRIDLKLGNQVFPLAQLLEAGIQGSRRINRIRVLGTRAYLACDFGVVILNLQSKSFANSVRFTDDAAFSSQQAFDIARWQGFYWIGLSDGLYRLPENGNIRDLTSWEPYLPVFGEQIRALLPWNGFLYCVQGTSVSGQFRLLRIESNGTVAEQAIPQNRNLSHLQAAAGHLLVVADSAVMRFAPPFQLQEQYTYGLGPFSDATVDENGVMWMSSSRFGLVRGGEEGVFNSGPNRPFSPSVHKIRFLPNGDLWVASGGLTGTLGPIFRTDQLFYRDEGVWGRLTGEGTGSPNPHRDIITLAVDPGNPSRAYAGSFASGLYKLDGFSISENIQGQPLESGPGGIYSIAGMDFDRQGNLWFGVSFVNNSLGKLSPDGNFTFFTFPGFTGSAQISDVLVDNGGRVWMAVVGRGIAVLDPGTNNRRLLTGQFNSGDINDLTIRTMHKDRNGEIWIGTNDGLRVFSPGSVFTSQEYNGQRIVIQAEDGNNELLLAQTIINEIRSDGGNRKWIATRGAGVRLVSSDGRRVIHNFTAENSPLLSNNVLTVDIDPLTGEVYFGTDLGICSFRGDATEANDSFGFVYVFPNPVRETYHGPVTITGLARDADVKITDVSGNLVHETKAVGGQATWNGLRYDGRRPQTGVYLVFLTNRDGTEAMVTKFLFIR